MNKKIISLVVVVVCLMAMVTPAVAAIKPTILFIPHDDRPVSFAQSADTVQKLAYELVTPPPSLLGNRTSLGKPDELWEWLLTNANRADAVVLSADSLLYGSLVGSRKHDYAAKTIVERAAKFTQLKQANPQLKIYVFGSIMRTPRSGAASGTEEPGYYAQYGADIFALTALTDKGETTKLTRGEQAQLKSLKAKVPAAALQDWLGRRDKNFRANLAMVDMARQGMFSYLALGRDDNAPFSQTHMESRRLDAAAVDLGVSKFQTVSGIDEMGMILLTRAVNDQEWSIPLVAVRYGAGVGEQTVPSYSDEAIGTAIRSHLFAAGAIPVPSTKRADLVLLVNTNSDGVTFEANNPENDGAVRENTQSFVDAVAAYIAQGQRVGIADIAFANGADNALMAELNKRQLLPQLVAYSGWNTANNSAGFAIGQGILAYNMTAADKNALLCVRFLDDWAYQANIRQAVAIESGALVGGSYGKLDNAKGRVTASVQRKMEQFAKQNLPQFAITKLTVDFPWNRMFETSVVIQ